MTILNGPLVTVGFTTKDRANLLSAALESLLSQTYKNIEFIVSDNASSDNTENVIRAYAAKDSRIRYARQSVDIGGLENMAFTLQEARGEYFMWAADDDWWDPRFVESLVSALGKNPDYGVAMSHYYDKKIVDGRDIDGKLRAHDYTNMSHSDLYKLYIGRRKSFLGLVSGPQPPPIFIGGLYRTNLRKKMSIPLCYNGIYIFLSEAALATRFYSVPDALFIKFSDPRPHKERHANHSYQRAHEQSFAVTRYVIMLVSHLLFSKAIPLHRKVLIFRPWIERVWRYKRAIAYELIKRNAWTGL